MMLQKLCIKFTSIFTEYLRQFISASIEFTDSACPFKGKVETERNIQPSIDFPFHFVLEIDVGSVNF